MKCLVSARGGREISSKFAANDTNLAATAGGSHVPCLRQPPGPEGYYDLGYRAKWCGGGVAVTGSCVLQAC